MQHAERGVGKAVNALGVQVPVEHTAEDLANFVEGEPLPDDHL